MELLREQWREAARGEVMGDVGFWVEDVEIRGMSITGSVVEGTGWRVIGSWDELRDAMRKGSYRSEGTYTTNEEGRTQFLSHPQRAMTWNGGSGRKWSPVALVEVDLAGLPFRMLRSPEQWFPDDDDPTEGRIWPDVGTGLGIEGNIPLDRIKAVHLFSDGRIYESHPDWRAFVSAKISITARSKDVGYRGVTLPLNEKQGVPILEALAAGRINVAARLIIDAMAEAKKDRWWAAGAQEEDEAGRWWTGNRGDALDYAMSDTGAWMDLPVLMTAEIAASYEMDSQGYAWWHLEPGSPIRVTQFEAILPDDPQGLLDAWRGVVSEGNFDAPGSRWSGDLKALPIPPMQTTAAEKTAAWYHEIESAYRHAEGLIGAPPVARTELDALLVSILSHYDVPNAEYAYTWPNPHGDAYTSMIGWDHDGVMVPVVFLGSGMQDQLTVCHEAAHLIDSFRSGWWGRPRTDVETSHGGSWAKLFVEVLARFYPKAYSYIRSGFREHLSVRGA